MEKLILNEKRYSVFNISRYDVERIAYLDYIRVIATFAVIIIHVVAQNWKNVSVNSVQWMIFDIYNGITKWAVPVFVMISGVVFLNKKSTDLGKYILRLCLAFVFWSIIYYFFFGGGLISLLVGRYHMWFIPMIVGLYICTPVIRKITEDEVITNYFMMIALVFVFLLPWIISLIDNFLSGILVKQVVYALKYNLENWHLFST